MSGDLINVGDWRYLSPDNQPITVIGLVEKTWKVRFVYGHVDIDEVGMADLLPGEAPS